MVDIKDPRYLWFLMVSKVGLKVSPEVAVVWSVVRVYVGFN